MTKIDNGVIFDSKYEIVDVLEVLGKYAEEHPDEMPGNEALENLYDVLQGLFDDWKW